MTSSLVFFSAKTLENERISLQPLKPKKKENETLKI
jgi:hypothetical protein